MTDAMSYEVHLDQPYEEALPRVIDALKTESFGVLSNIDVRATLKEKIDKDFRPYAILGVCNPALAYRALSHSAEVGLMLPCNVTVESEGSQGTTVRIINPETMLQGAGMGDDPELKDVAVKAGEKLERVAQALAVASA
ncbi:MAG: DUF302 domain-containing protein [Thermoleophilia bacterium]